MPKRTLLDMTQSILDSMASDQVNSIDDTEEAYTIAKIIRDTYYDIVTLRLWPQHYNVRQLVAVADDQHPTHMLIPEDVSEIKMIQYNKKDQMSDATGLEEYKEIQYLDPIKFLSRLQQRQPSGSNIQIVIDSLSNSGARFLIQNDKQPEFWTSFDDEYIIFDSFNSTYDDTLQSQKTHVWCLTEPTFDLLDTFVPDLPAKAFPYLLEEAKSTAFVEVRGSANQKAEQKSQRQRAWLARRKWRTNGGLKTTTYGRK